MDPRLLPYYERELSFLREMGAEFAKQFSKIAGRLGMDGLEVADPYVERLLEGFAFLAARVQLKLDDEFPRFTQHLLNIVYPQYLAPTPSMAVVHLSPNPREGSLSDGVLVPRGTVMRSLLGKDDQTACEYRSAHDVTLWPLEIVDADYRNFVGGLDVPAAARSKARAMLRLTLRTTSGQSFDELPLERLPIFLHSPPDRLGAVYEQLVGHTSSMWLRPHGSSDPWRRAGGAQPVRPLGFAEDEALLPRTARSFEGYRLLHEYFAFPSRYDFVELGGLQPALGECAGETLDVLLLLDAAEQSLEAAITPTELLLHCTPAINLFSRRADRIHLTDSDHEYHVVVDRTRPMDFEVYSVEDVVGYGAGMQEKQPFAPFYAHGKMVRGDDAAFFTVRREQRRLSRRQRAQGTRSSYVGSETFVALVDGDEGPFRSGLKQLAVQTMCTNRDLPLHMAVGQGRTDFTLESGAPVAEARCVAGPTPPRASHAHGNMAWRLVSHLSLNYLSLTDVDTLRELLLLYADIGDASTKRQIESVREVDSQSIVRRVTARGGSGLARGVGVTLTVDEAGFHGSSAFLLGAVLERFFAKYTSINSFTETTLRTPQRGEIQRWPPRTGQMRAL